MSSGENDASYAGTGEWTFDNEDSLPSFPVPSLQMILTHYVETVQPFATKEEFRKIQENVTKFGLGVGKQLYEKVLTFAHNRRNWMVDLLKHVWYLDMRHPVSALTCDIVYLCFPSPFCLDYWKPQIGTQLERASLVMWYHLKFWQLIRTETLKPNRNANKTALSMAQYRRLFSACRIPGEVKDWNKCSFKTVREGSTPVHIVVMCRGRIFTFDAVTDQNEPITAPEIQRQLQHVQDMCDSDPDGQGVGILSTHERTTWHRVRTQLIEHATENSAILHIIETSIMVLSLEDSEPRNFTERGRLYFCFCQPGFSGRDCQHDDSISDPTNGIVSSTPLYLRPTTQPRGSTLHNLTSTTLNPAQGRDKGATDVPQNLTHVAAADDNRISLYMNDTNVFVLFPNQSSYTSQIQSQSSAAFKPEAVRTYMTSSLAIAAFIYQIFDFNY